MDSRHDYNKDLAARLEHAQAKLDALKAVANDKTVEARSVVDEHVDEQIQVLEDKVRQIEEEIAESAREGKGRWAEIKNSLAGAWCSLTGALKRDSPSRGQNHGRGKAHH